MDYRERLVAARERMGLSRREMAARLLTPRQTYEQWERGFRRTPGVAVVAAEGMEARRPRGEVLEKVAALANGTLSVVEMARAVHARPASVRNALRMLARDGRPARWRRLPPGRKPELDELGDDA